MTSSFTLSGSSFAWESGGAVKPTAADDAALVDRFLRIEDEEALEMLVRRYQDKIVRLAASILGRRAEGEAEDAAQEVFIVVLRKLKTFRGESAFSTWLYRVARNQIVDYRRRARQRTSDLSEPVLRTILDTGALADPQGVVAAAEKRAWLMDHVDRLREPQRVVVHLHYWQGQSVGEISELLGLRPSTVKSHLFRARQGLAAAIRGDGRED